MTTGVQHRTDYPMSSFSYHLAVVNVIDTDDQDAWSLAYGSEWSFPVLIIHIEQQNWRFGGPQKQMARYCSLP